jgi:thiol:disulfide interchange protein
MDPSTPQPAAERTRRPLREYLWVLILLILVPVWLVALKGNNSAGGEDTIAWHHDFQAARALAADNQRPLLLDFTADWCPPCRTMDRQVMPDPRVHDAITTGFVPVKVDLSDRRPGPAADLAHHYDVSLIPTFLIVDAHGQVLARHAGVMNAGEFVNWLQRAQPALP